MASAMIDLGANKRAREQLEAALLVAEASGYDRLSALARSHMAVLAFKKGFRPRRRSLGVQDDDDQGPVRMMLRLSTCSLAGH